METSTEYLSELIAEAETYFRNLNYSSKTIQRYKRIWKKFYLRRFTSDSPECAINSYPFVTSIIYIDTQTQDRTTGSIFRIRAIRSLDEIHKQQVIKHCYKHPGIQVQSCYADLLNAYLDEQIAAGIAQRTAKGKSIHMTKFLNHLYDNGLSNINLLCSELILSYASSMHDYYTRNSVSAILFTLRNFLLYIYEKGLTSKPFNELFPVIYSIKKDRLPSYYDEDELKKVLASVDRDAVIGKRDYLILILAVQLGIRASDIRMLQITVFHWEKNTIEFVQQKTGNPISLPMPDNIKYAWIDFVKNSRPEIESPYIFIRNRAPYEPYVSSNVFYYVITRYMKAAKVDYTGRKHGLHAMRHSLASNLLKNNTPYPVITGILGHENASSTEIYLSIDIEALRSVALEVPDER